MSGEQAERGVEVIVPGPLSTVQDHGRHGVQHLGFSPSGACDHDAFTLGNLLLGNDSGAAAIEVTLGDAVFRLRGDSLFVVTGAAVDLDLDGRPLHLWCVYAGAGGAVLRVGRARRGVRVYVCVAGGIDVPLVYGSRATDLLAGIGGHEGRALRASDVMRAGVSPEGGAAGAGRCLAPAARPLQPGIHVVRAVPGPQRQAFTWQSERTLYGSVYRVSHRADRTGLSLDGPRLWHVDAPDILSEGVTAGSIQVPGEGQPLVLLAEHRSVGGYAKIATVCAMDLAVLGQARPGDGVLFVRTDRGAAQTAARAAHAMYGWTARVSSLQPPLVQGSLSLDEWPAAVDRVIGRIMVDERLALLRSDLEALGSLFAGGARARAQGRQGTTSPLDLQIQALAPGADFPRARLYAPVAGTLLALHAGAASVPRGTIVAALWKPGSFTVILALHPLASYRLCRGIGQVVRDGDLLLDGTFLDAVGVLDAPPTP